MSLNRTRPNENRTPEFIELPDGRKRLTRFFALPNGANLTDALVEAYGTVDVGPATGTTAGFAGLRLVDQRLVKINEESFWQKTYEELPATAELQVGGATTGNTTLKLPDGRTAYEAEFLQLVAGTYTPGTVGTTTAPGDTSAYLQKEEATNDGTLRRIKRSYVGAGTIQTSDETKHDGALLLRTIVSVKTVPSTPADYTLISTRDDPSGGLPVYTYTFAKGTGEISREIDYSQTSDQGVTGITRTTIRYLTFPDAAVSPSSLAGSVLTGKSSSESDGHRIWTTTWAKGTGTISTQNETKNNGALLLRTVRALGAAPSTPSGYALTSTDSTEQDGFTIYTYGFAQGSGEISRSVDYSQSSDFGATGVTRTTIRHLTPTATTSDPTTLSGSVKVGEDKSESEGHRIWTITYAKGTGLVTDDTDYSNQGALTRYHRVSLGAIPTSPSGASGALSRVTVTAGGTGYTSAPTVTISGGGGSGATATAVLSDRTVVALSLGSGGSGYTSAPTISFSGGGGTGASATAVLATRTVASIAVSAAGSGYTSVPTVSVSGNGTGSTATAVLTGTSIASIALTAAGSGYTSTPTVAITGGGGTGATATVTVSGGSILSLTLTNAGSGYTSAPTLSFSGGGGTGAAATCALTATTVASATVAAAGSGFTSAPTVAVSGGGGTGAAVTAALTGTTLASITITAGGSGYTSAPTVSITGGGGSGATGTAVLNVRSVASITVTNAGSGYTTVPTISFSGGGGSGAAATVSLTGTTLASATLAAAGSGFTGAPTASISGGGGSGGAVTAVLTATSVASVTVTAGGTYSGAPTVSFSGGGGSGAAATVQTTGGVLLKLDSGGSGYSANFAVIFSGGGGSGASALAVVSGGAVIGFLFNSLFGYSPGSGYTSDPTVSFANGSGSGAAATVVRTGGLRGVNMSSSGSGYSSEPTVSFSGGGGSGAVGVSILDGSRYVAISDPGTGYTSAPTVSFSGGGGSGAAGTSEISTITVSGVTITSGGTGYTSAPSVSFSSGGATATAALTPTTVASLTLSAAGTGYTSAPTLSISGGGGSGATGTVAITGTTLASIAVTNGGTGYTTAPTLSFSGGGGGSGATATAGMNSAAVASVTLTNAGTGYTSAPSVSFSGGSGVDAAATAAMTPTTVASLTVSAAGSGYTSSPTLTISGGGGTGATGIATLTGTTIASVSVTASGSGYTSTPTVGFSGGGGTGAAATVASTGVTITGFTITAAGSGYTSVPAAVVSGGGGSGALGTPVLTATTVASVTVTAAGSGFTAAPSVSFSGGGGSGAAATATLSTAAVASLTITSGGTGYTSAPTVAFSGGGGSGAASTATVSTASVLSVTLTAPGTGYTSSPTIAFSGGGGSGAAAFSPAGLVAVLISANIRKEAGFDIYDYTWAAGSGVISSDVSYSNQGKLVRYKKVALGTAPTAPSATLGGTVTLISDDSRDEGGVTVYDRTWAEGKGVISISTQARDGGLRLETWVSLGQSYDASFMLPAGILMDKDSDDREGHTVWTVTCIQNAAGTSPLVGTTVSSIELLDPGVTDYASAPTVTISGGGGSGATATATVSGGVITGFTVANAGSGYTSAPQVTISGGTWYTLPTALASLAGNVISREKFYPFTYPGRAKAIELANPDVGGSYNLDAQLTPPIETEVLGTEEISYRTDNSLSDLTYPKWAPKEWATVFAQWISTGNAVASSCEGLRGYRAEDGSTSVNRSGTAGKVSVLGKEVYASTTAYLKVFGGPDAPDNRAYTLTADTELAFVGYDGTKYYRRTIGYATIPAQAAMPTLSSVAFASSSITSTATLKAVTTVGVAAGTRTNSFLYTWTQGGFIFVGYVRPVLTAGTLSADTISAIKPTDYHASTNAKYWKLIA